MPCCRLRDAQTEAAHCRACALILLQRLVQGPALPEELGAMLEGAAQLLRELADAYARPPSGAAAAAAVALAVVVSAAVPRGRGRNVGARA